ncbi:MAG TPA: hypothetical protein VJL86_07260, partial [Steroidobacteraceae bacterium]|nr:hypothetical protein [Steroidobacteraceae bacterium]
MRPGTRAAALVASWAFAGLSLAAEAPASQAPRKLGLEDIEAVKSPSSVAISRDGRQVAYVLDKQIFVVPVAGGAPRVVTAAVPSAWSPRWSRDGLTLYFLSDR